MIFIIYLALNNKLNVDDWTQQELKDFVADFKSRSKPLENSATTNEFNFAEEVPSEIKSLAQIPVPRNNEEDNASSPRSGGNEYIDEEPLTLKGEIPTKHQIKGYESTNKIKKGILNNNRVRVTVSDITILKANILVQYAC